MAGELAVQGVAGNSLAFEIRAFAHFTKARDGSSNSAIACARLTRLAATMSRRRVVLPVPGGPFTARIRKSPVAAWRR